MLLPGSSAGMGVMFVAKLILPFLELLLKIFPCLMAVELPQPIHPKHLHSGTVPQFQSPGLKSIKTNAASMH